MFLTPEALISISYCFQSGANTTYNVNEIPAPEVRLLSPSEITEEYYDGADVRRPESGIDFRTYALYNREDAENGIVFLHDPRLNDTLTLECWRTCTVAAEI